MRFGYQIMNANIYGDKPLHQSQGAKPVTDADRIRAEFELLDIADKAGLDTVWASDPLEEEEAPMEREYVGIDFHRRRSVVVRVSAAGERLSVVRVDNDPVALAAAVTEAGPSPEVVIEATYGWYWVVDLLQELSATVHLANPKALNWGDRRVKNDVVDGRLTD